MITLRDTFFIVGCVVFVAATAVAVGCASSNGGAMRTDMPFLEMDASPPPRTARTYTGTATRQPARSVVAQGPRAWNAPRTGRTWRYIVMHHSATESGNAAEFDTLHREKGWDELGYHFVIDNGRGGPDGRVEVGSRWTKQKHGAHTGGTPGNEYNEYGIGICLVGNFMRHRPTRAQLKAVTELTEYLAERYDLGQDDIIAHKDAPNQHTECCGRRFYPYVHSQLKRDVGRRLARR